VSPDELEKVIDAVRREERTLVAAWLREQGKPMWTSAVLPWAAGQIEDGAHLPRKR
jgi:hypothetical protein